MTFAGPADNATRQSESPLPTFAELVERLARVEQERDEYRKLYMLLREENAQLKRGLIGARPQLPPDHSSQLTLDLLGLVLNPNSNQPPPPPPIDVPAHTRRKAVRKPLPEDLPHITIELVPPEVERQGLDSFEVIGADKRQSLERRPASLVVVETIKKKFMLRDQSAGTRIFVAETPELPIPRSNAGPGLLADTIVKRWQDHLPLHRLESIYARDGVELARSTICGWHEELADLARPVVEAMHADALAEPYLCTDATGVLVMFPKRCKTGHFWVLVAPGKHVLFAFSLRHDSAAVDALLKDYRGYLVADAHAVYDHLYRDAKVIEVGCWSHCRRYFLEALASDPERARHALTHIQGLFLIERTIAEAPPARRARIRQEQSKPIVDKFFTWCQEHKDLVLDASPIADAIRYATNQQQALKRFLDDARLPLHNNISELHLRRQAIGRKNWLFVGSEDGARTNTVFVSLLASCAMHRIEPWGYIRDLLCLLPSWPIKRVLELAPASWSQTFETAEVQQKLDANIYRRVVLGLDPTPPPHREPP